jgi:D-alanine-D-alanine ligase
VIPAIDTSIFDVIQVGITKDGVWFLQDDIQDGISKDKLPEVLPVGLPVSLSINRNHQGLIPLDSTSDAISVDVVFPILHGRFGEDGTIQGALEFANIACVGAGSLASALAMDKSQFKSVMKAHNLPVVKSVGISRFDWLHSQSHCFQLIEELQFPLFVKPARAGSSLGVSKVLSRDSLPLAIEDALHIDDVVLVEEAVVNPREIECGVLVQNGVARASLPSEIRVKAGFDFYSYEAKYVDDSTELIVPAILTSETQHAIQKLAVKVFKTIGAEGYARVDFLLDETGSIFVNELNTIPGFTNISMFPRMFVASGLPYEELVNLLIQDALQRHGK